MTYKRDSLKYTQVQRNLLWHAYLSAIPKQSISPCSLVRILSHIYSVPSNRSTINCRETPSSHAIVKQSQSNTSALRHWYLGFLKQSNLCDFARQGVVISRKVDVSPRKRDPTFSTSRLRGTEMMAQRVRVTLIEGLRYLRDGVIP